MSGGGGPSTITQNTAPPAYAQPYHESLLYNTAKAASRPYQPYPGAQIAGFTPEQEMGLNAMAVRGMQGSPVDRAAQGNAVNTLNGTYMNPATSGLGDMMNYATRNLVTNYGAQLGRNFGNAGVIKSLGEDVGRATAGIWDAERNRQLSAMGMAPGLSSTDFRDIQGVLGAGDARQGMAQKQVDLPAQQWMAAQTYPGQQIGLMGGALGATGGYSSGSQPNPYVSNPMANAIGMGTLGYMGGSALAASPMMAGSSMTPYAPWIGAGLGAAYGLLSR